MSKENSVTPLGCLAAIGYLPILMVISALMHGWALSTLWSWFVVNTFHAIPLTYLQAIGLSLVIRLLTYHVDNAEKKETKPLAEVLIGSTFTAVFMPTFSVFISWVVLQFMR